MGKIPKKRHFIVTIVVLVVITGIIIVPRILSTPVDQTLTISLSPVVLAHPTYGRLEQSLSFSGHLKAETTTTVVSKIGSRILDILVSDGDRVVQDEIVTYLEEDTVKLQMEQARAAYQGAQAQFQKANQAVRPEELASAKASLAQAEEDLRIAQTNLERTKNLFEAGSMSRSAYEDAQNAVKSGETQVGNARRQVSLLEEGARQEDIQMARSQADASGKQLELAQLQLSYAKVRAPISGVVAKIHADRGNMVGVGSPILTIVSDSTIFATVLVPEQYYGRFYTQADKYEIEVSPIAYADMPPFKGKITGVSSIIDASTRNFEIEIAIDNNNALLKPGMFVRVNTVFIDQNENLLVPNSAVLLRDGRHVVFVSTNPEENETLSVLMKPVTVGNRSSEQTQILEGITLTDLIVVEGNAFLEDGQLVAAVN